MRGKPGVSISKYNIVPVCLFSGISITDVIFLVDLYTLSSITCLREGMTRELLFIISSLLKSSYYSCFTCLNVFALCPIFELLFNMDGFFSCVKLFFVWLRQLTSMLNSFGRLNTLLFDPASLSLYKKDYFDICPLVNILLIA